MNTKHTPGEWKASPVSSVVGSLITADGVSVATALPRMTAEEVQANALLIAAAPDLLRAAMLQEQADDHWANCEECEDSGAEAPEFGCEIAFKLADNARVLRRAAIVKVLGEEVKQ